MALKATIHKLQLQIADMDRAVYADHALTLALHPSETEERMMVRLLAFALHAPADDRDGGLQFARGLSDGDEPDLWQHDLTGRLQHWIEVGQPDERRLLKAAGRAERVTVIAYGAAVALWWAPLEARVARAGNLEVWQLPNDESRALAGLAQRSMTLQVNAHDGVVWVGDGERAVSLSPRRLKEATR
ncbi:MAG: YaeQ family protein [Burkholderiaceae bacterium]|nr:YaeQ family protein [Burkholderiaceae bacterium]